MEMVEANLPSHHDQEDELLQSPTKPKGGLVTLPFIIANEAFERVASFGLTPNMIFYLMNEYKMEVTNATNLLFYWSAATNFFPLLGAFLADSYLGRFLTIGFGSIASLLGMIQLWLTAIISRARPPPCNQLIQTCKTTTPAQYTLLVSSFGLMSIGAGGIRSCSIAFGADQFNKKDNVENERLLESFFGWYFAAVMFSIVIALTGIVYIQDHLGWKVGFGIPVVLMFFSCLMFFIAFPLYIKQKPSNSLFTGIFQVMVVAYKNRRIEFPPHDSNGYHHEKGSINTTPTEKLRFLNKACIIKNPEDVTSTGVSSNPWVLCTIEQVEELKSLIKVIPIWSTGIIFAINNSQGSFPALLANSMDRHITSSFQFPAGSFSMFFMLSLTLWVILYDRAIIPLVSKIAGRKVHLGVKLKMGIGMFISCMAVFISGLVEHVRRKKAIEQGFRENPSGVVNMSAMWLVPQNCLLGLAEAFFAVGQTEFYYAEFPKSMSSIAASLFGIGMGVASLLASVVLNAVDGITKSGGRESWVSSNINKGHYDYYYWVLAAMTGINLMYFMVCSWAYGPCVDDNRVGVMSDGEGSGLELEHKLSREEDDRIRILPH